ncbi:uncharacterized protein LOC134209968 [Armigeres subalbatus]|uniref:uncharacterized protein LOC134209968 n=1 Tax=Armigeres subalbatus TaxID=124917 RepID=UPI002ED4EE42
MGNSLCKEPRAGRPMRPGRVMDNFGSIMCPNGLGKSKQGINKTYLSRHVLETSSKPDPVNNWNNEQLSSPDSSKIIDRAPVAPPRKKRSTLERGNPPEVKLKVRNGFKDVFGAESRRQSYDVVIKSKPIDTVDKGLPMKAQSSFEIDLKDDEFSDFSKIPTKTEMEPSSKMEAALNNGTTKVSHVGNRKSDRFFGENLSDALSNEPVVTERRKSAKKGIADLDKIDKFIEQNVLTMNAKPDPKDVPDTIVTVPVVKSEKEKKMEDSKIETSKDVSASESNDDKNLIKYIDESMVKETSLGKKAEFLMAMLEDYPEDRYIGMAPVEEPVIIPRKRKSRHICDDDEHMHNMHHKHDNETKSSKNLITTEASIETPPRKPDRDFSKYVAPMADGEDTDDSASSGPIRMRPAQPSPPSPRVVHKIPRIESETEFQQNVSNTVTSTPKKLDAPVEPDKAHSPRTLKRILSVPSTIHVVQSENKSPSPKHSGFVKSNSSSSFLNMDLQQAHQKVVPFTPEESGHHAAEELVKPKSRLVARKISTKSNDNSPCSATSTLEVPTPKFTIGSIECLSKPQDEPPPPPVPKRMKPPSGDIKRSPPRDLLGYDLGGFLVSSKVLPHHDVTQVINSVYNDKNNGGSILEEFQVYLEDQINSELNNPNPTNPNTVKLLEVLGRQSNPGDKLEDISIELVESENSNKSSDIDDCFDPEFEKIEKTEVEEAVNFHGSVDDVDNWFENNSDAGSVIEGSDKLGTMVTVKGGAPRMGRRESIEDVDNWFQHHNQASHHDDQIIGVRRQRRGSDGLLGYDTTRQYPFGSGRKRHDSQSAELFEDITKLHELGSAEDVKAKTPLSVVKNDRLRDRRGSDGLIFYDTSRKFPFGEPNENLPKAIEKSQKIEQKSVTNKKGNDSTLSIANVEKHTAKENTLAGGSSDHSTLLKFLSNEKLIE